MEEASSHAVSLLASLNLQRERAQFCDCVVRQTQNPGQLYPAHRCVLAASSPVLASILSSAGVLVELQTPCLSDSVLALVLDFIYSGTLLYTCSQQQYYNLLTAACYLQMDELQEALKTMVNAADNANVSSGAENQPYKDINNPFSKYLPLSEICNVNSLDQYCDEMDTCSSKNGTNHHSSKGANPLNNVSTSVAGSTGSSVNTGKCRQATSLQDLIQNIPCTADVHTVSRVDKEVQKAHFHSADAVKPESWQMSTEEELVRTAENRRSSYLLCAAGVQEDKTSRAETTQPPSLTVKSKAEEKDINRKEEDEIHHSPLYLSTSDLKDNVSPSHCYSSPSHPCGAVPVIRHSSEAAMADVSAMSPYHPVSPASVSPSSAPDLRSGSTDNDRIIEGSTAKQNNQNQDYSNNKDHAGTQSWDDKDNSDQCVTQILCYKSNADQSDFRKQDCSSSNTDHVERMGNRLSSSLSFKEKNNKNHLFDDSVPKSKDYSSFSNFCDFHSKHQRIDCSGCHSVLMATAAEEQFVHSQDPRTAVALPVQDSDTGSDSYCEDLHPKGEAKEEHSYSSRCPAEMDRHCNLYEPKTVWYPNMHRAENENISGTEISEPHQTFTMPVDNSQSDPMYDVVGQSYHGHLHYHCLPQEDTHVSYEDSDHSHPSHPDHSDKSSDEEEADTFANPGLSPMGQHFATTDQILLLDISAKPAELLVSYKDRSAQGEKWVACSQKDKFGNGFENDDREQQNEATSAARVDWPKTWDGKTNVEERKSTGKGQSRPGVEVIHKAGFVKDGNQTTTMIVCSPPIVPDSVQASVSSTLPVCIPSTQSTSMPTDISAHLSSPVHHPFQCSLCDRSFSQRGSLNRHVRSHLGVRPFPCPRCPMTFSRQYRVTEHMRVHQRCVLGSDFQKPPASSI